MHPTIKRLYGQSAASALARLERRLQHMPLDRAIETGERFGRLVHRIGTRRRQRAESNLAGAFPHWPESRVRETALRSFEHFGAVAADFLAGSGRSREEVEALTQLAGIEHLDQALSAGKGALLLTGHYGHWERGAQILSHKGYAVSAVARDADDLGVNKIVNDARRRPGTEIISRGDSAVAVLRALRSGRVVAILADQNAEDAFLPFLGRIAGVNCGAGVLAARTGTPVLPCWTRHLGGGRVVGAVEPPLPKLPDPGPPGSGTMLAYHRWLERVIAEVPEQWLWFHDRWRYAREAGLR